jgi:23S rRNA (guanosine2251-2'-O)-methyltransferase
MIVYGKQISLYIVDNFPEMIKTVYLQKEIDKKLFYRFSNLGKKIVKVDPKKAQAMARGGNHQGFLLEIEDIEFTDFKDIKDQSSFLLVLHNITDIGNIGAIVRSAYAFGVDAIVITAQKNFSLEPVIRSSSGAMLKMPMVLYSSALNLINELKTSGYKTYGAGFGGKDIRSVEFFGKKAVFLGNEGEGIPQKVLSKLDEKITIDMVRDFNSLNVSAAAAIICDRIANGQC